MAQVTKTEFSEAELNILTRSDFFLLKHSATKKVIELFGDLEREMRINILSYPFLNHHSDISMGKIFRGESYRQLPYVVLDYPKKFSADSVFTFRTMFWWGNEFSFTLHVQGHSLEHFRDRIRKNISNLQQQDFFFCVNSKPWDYYFNEDNYQSLDKLLANSIDLDGIIQLKEFIKLSRKLPIENYENVPECGLKTFELLMKILS